MMFIISILTCVARTVVETKRKLTRGTGTRGPDVDTRVDTEVVTDADTEVCTTGLVPTGNDIYD